MATKPDNELEEQKRIGDLLDRDEWDFSRCPEERIYFCFTYEYAREIPSIIERFRYAQEHDREQFDEEGQWHHVVYNDVQNPAGAFLEVIDAPPGFPEKPYLQTIHFVTENSHIPFDVGQRPLRPVIVKPDGGYEAADWYRPDDLAPDQVFHFHVNWRFADKPIVEAFAEWLDKAREGHEDRKAQEKRGRSEPRRCRSDLKTLAMARLVRHFAKHGSTIEAASAYAANVEGIPRKWQLYSEATDWAAAKGEVQKIIDEWLKE